MRADFWEEKTPGLCLWLKGGSTLTPAASRGRSGPSEDNHFLFSSGQRAGKDSKTRINATSTEKRSKASPILDPLRRVALCPVTSTRWTTYPQLGFQTDSPLPVGSCSELELPPEPPALQKSLLNYSWGGQEGSYTAI